MRFACTQENLAQGLGLVGHVSGKNVNLPVLGNVLLKTEAGSLKLSTTNLEVAVNCLVRGKVEVEGEYSVPSKLFLDYVSLLASGKVELELTDEGLKVTSGEQETVLKGMPSSEFPLLPKLAKDEGYKLPVEDFKRAVGQVAFATSSSESRPELMGVAAVFGGGKVAFAATDSYRLAERIVNVEGPTAEHKAIIPAKTLVEAARIVNQYKDEMSMPETVTLSFTDNQLLVRFGTVELVSRLIEGSFPDYKPLLPQNFQTEAVVGRQEFSKAMRAGSLFARQGIFDVHVSVDPETGNMLVESADQGTGKTKTNLKATVKGTANKLTLNYRYVMDGLAAMESKEVRIKQNDPLAPALIVPEGDKEQYTYLVMPIRSV